MTTSDLALWAMSKAGEGVLVMSDTRVRKPIRIDRLLLT